MDHKQSTLHYWFCEMNTKFIGKSHIKVVGLVVLLFVVPMALEPESQKMINRQEDTRGRIKIAKFDIETKSIIQTQCRYRNYFNCRVAPTAKTILRIARTFNEKNLHKGNTGRRRTARTQQNIEAVRMSGNQSPEKGYRRRARELRLSSESCVECGRLEATVSGRPFSLTYLVNLDIRTFETTEIGGEDVNFNQVQLLITDKLGKAGINL
ncbi:hypothetical protein C0J52_27541 [Blattella germanica]|nr:hypothetical protein C0J52_27541 [Blattella germanica]